MKTLCQASALVVSAIVAIVAVVNCSPHQASLGPDVPLEIGKDKQVYVEVDKTKLDAALNALKAHGGKCFIAYMDANGNVTERYGGCTDEDLPPCGQMDPKTDKVTMSAKAKNGITGESAVNDPNITYRIRAPGKYVKKVVNSFQD
jgi:hypothetical protein